VFKTGIATDYPAQRPGAGEQYYQTITEGRSCSACGCNPACGGSVSVFAGTACSGTSSTLPIADPTTCTPIVKDANVGQSDHHAFQWNNPGAVCGTVPSTLSGAPSPDSPITVCCQAP
jgi:hypothetical protein